MCPKQGSFGAERAVRLPQERRSPSDEGPSTGQMGRLEGCRSRIAGLGLAGRGLTEQAIRSGKQGGTNSSCW